jgi:SdrD B-like domain
MFDFVRTLLPKSSRRLSVRTGTARPGVLPGLEALEERAVPTVSSIVSNFNGTAIPDNSTIWFSSVAKVSGVGSAPATINVTDQTISYVANGTTNTVNLPNSQLTLTPGATSASATFDASSNTWDISAPSSVSGNVFLGGGALSLPNGLPGGVKNVTWSADFTTNTSGIMINWQWAASAYSTTFPSDLSGVGVKPVDANNLSVYKNSDHAGTPENFKSFVLGGARGGGGSNFTGSYSGTASIYPGLVLNPPPATLSGFVYYDSNQDGVFDSGDAPLQDQIVNLTGVDTAGDVISVSTSTGTNGSYSFSGLLPGTYQVSVVPSNPLVASNVGTVGGFLDGTVQGDGSIASVVIAAGNQGINYNFGEYTPPVGS